jgi:transposase
VDGHKASRAVASGAQDQGAEVPSLGALGARQCDLDHLVRTRPSQAKPLLFVYEAGPWGSWRSRSLTTKGSDWGVVAPSLIPHTPGARVTTARRDAVPRARLARSGDLPVVDVPTVDAEAIRDRSRAREEAISALNDAKFRLNALLLRQASRDVGRAHRRPAHLRWLSEVVCPTPAPHIVFQADGHAVKEPTAPLQRLAQALRAQVKAWRFNPVVAALQALRGVQCLVAVTLVAAVGALTRVETSSARMTFLSRIPSDYTRAERRRHGAMTTAGHTHARRVLVEGAWASRDPAPISRHRPLRREQHPNVIQAIR